MIAIRSNPRFANTRIEHLYQCMIKQKFTDFNFAVRNRRFCVHLAVMSDCCNSFENNLNEMGDIFSNFDDIIIDAVLKYCYIGEIHIDENHLSEFLKLANTLSIDNIVLEKEITNFQNINLSNCLEALWLSNDPTTKHYAMNLTLENFLTLYKTPEFFHLPVSTVIKILKSDYLNVSSEEYVFKSVKLWIDYDRVNRKAMLSELLSSVRLTLLSIMFLTTEVMVYCYSSPECVIIVNEAMQIISSNLSKNIILKDNHRKRSAKLAVFGSRHKTGVENTMDVYDIINNKWILSKNFEINRFDFATVVVDDWILIIGGQNDSSNVDYIDLKDGLKYSLKPLNAPRFYFSAVALNKDSSTDVYIIGGAESWLKPINTVERWNSKRQNWETNVAPLLLAVHSYAVSVVDGKIYVTGGCKQVKDDLEVVAEVQMYCPQTNYWSYLKPMNQKRRVHKSAEINGRLFVVGGLKDIPILSVISSVESYDPVANLWTLVCNLPSPRWGTSLSLFGDKLIFIGGHDGTSYLTDVLEYDVVNEKWCILKSLNVARSGGDSIFIPYNSFI